MASSSHNSNCSFYNVREKKCGFSSLSKGKDNVVLQDCTSDISQHLANCHLPKSLQEYEVILARAGIFRWNESFLESTIICPTHRDELGKYWRPSKSCQYPSHRGKPKRLKDTHVINVKLATEIFDLFGWTVPIGSRKSIFTYFRAFLLKRWCLLGCRRAEAWRRPSTWGEGWGGCCSTIHRIYSPIYFADNRASFAQKGNFGGDVPRAPILLRPYRQDEALSGLEIKKRN